MSVDNMEVDGAFNEEALIDISVQDIEAGVLDRARTVVFLCNWRNPNGGQYVRRLGFLGELSRDSDGKYTSEIRGLGQLLQQTIGRTYGERCNVVTFGDARCGIDVEGLKLSLAVSTSPDRKHLTAPLVGTLLPEFTVVGGLVRFTGGDNDGYAREVKRISLAGSTLTVETYDELSADAAPGDTFDLLPGCDRRYTTCRDIYQNLDNFRGWGVFIPGVLAMMAGPQSTGTCAAAAVLPSEDSPAADDDDSPSDVVETPPEPPAFPDVEPGDDVVDSGTVPPDPIVPPDSTSTRKHKAGFWPELNLLVPMVSDTAGWANLTSIFEQVAATLGVDGIQVILPYGVLEGDTQGDYSGGNAVIDRLIDLARDNDVLLSFHVWPRRFVSLGAPLPTLPQTSSTRPWPNYIQAAGGVAGGLPDQYAQTVKLWESRWNDCYISCLAHHMNRVDGSKWVHRWESEESADFDTWQGYDYAARRTEWKRWVDALAPRCVHTSLAVCLNWFDEFNQTGINRFIEWMEYVYQSGCDVGGPDTFAASISRQVDSIGALIFRRAGDIGSALSLDVFGAVFTFYSVRDYRGLMACGYHHEYLGHIARDVLYDHWHNVMRLTHYIPSVFNGESEIAGHPEPTTEWFFGANGLAHYFATRPAPLTGTACPANKAGLCSETWGTP
jgi:uncharacterized phage protein (TIGR02218 family)